MVKRDFRFYFELVAVTILSLVAANSWIRVVSDGITRWYPQNIKVDVLVAVVLTLLAVFVLHYLFSEPSKDVEPGEADAITPSVYIPEEKYTTSQYDDVECTCTKRPDTRPGIYRWK